MNAHQFVSERSKVAFIILRLSGKALNCAQCIWSVRGPITWSERHFVHTLCEVFSQSAWSLSTQDKLIRLRQGQGSVADYSLHFSTLVAVSGWNESSLVIVFWQGLLPSIRSEILGLDNDKGLENLIQRSVHITQRLAACVYYQPVASPPPGMTAAPVNPPEHEPMQIDHYHLSQKEWAHRLTMRLCFSSLVRTWC